MADGTWLDGWREFCESKQADYTLAAQRACDPEYGDKGVQRFAHHLDCEVPLDVWHELFKTYNHNNER